MSAKVVVYTAIFGGYDAVPEVSLPDPDLTYILFADEMIETAPAPWQLRRLPSIFSDPQRDARRVKVLPHLFLPAEYEISVWIDGNCQIKGMSASELLHLVGDSQFVLPAHAERQCAYEEAAVLLSSGLFDSPGRIARQMGAYQSIGFPHDFGLHHSNFVIRRHNDPACVHFAAEWWRQITLYSKRDQLSFDFVRWKLRQPQIETIRIPYDDNRMFRAGSHRMPVRIVSEHLGVAVRHKDLAQSFLAASYEPEYDAWPPGFIAHLHRLNEIVSESHEPIEGNLCYFHHQHDFRYAPPDPRRGARRENFLRALAGRSRLLEIGFNAGHSALLALTHSNATITSVDDFSHAYTGPAAAYLREAFLDRFHFSKLDSRELPTLSHQLRLRAHDMIHIDGGHAADVFASDIATAVTSSDPGTLVLIDDLYVPAIRQITDRLLADRLIVQCGDLETRESGAYVTLETDEPKDALAHPALVNRLMNFVSTPRLYAETPSPFMATLLGRLESNVVNTEPSISEAFQVPDSAALTKSLDDELIDEIRRIGYHPFVLLRNAASADETRFVICHTENETARFADDLRNCHVLSDSMLVRGIERALCTDVAGAAEMFFSWSAMRTRQSERIYLGLLPHVNLPQYYNYPMFEVAAEAVANEAGARITQLVAIFNAYELARGNDRSRFALMEALAIALSRWWGIHDQFDRAAEIMVRVLKINPTSRNLKVAVNALDLHSRAALNSTIFRRW